MVRLIRFDLQGVRSQIGNQRVRTADLSRKTGYDKDLHVAASSWGFN